MKRYIIAGISAIMCLGGITLSAQRTLSLEECRELALQNNASIRNSELASQAAKATRKEAFTKYFPDISAGGFAFAANHGILEHDFKGDIPIPPVPGLTEGGVIPFSYDFSLIKNGIMAGVTLVQPVFLGGEIINGNKLAEVGEAVAELQSRQSADQVRQTVEQYYWQLASLKAKQQTVGKLMSLLDVLQHDVDVAVKAGVTLPNDLLEVKLRRNEMETDSIQLANGINVISSLLAQYVGLGIQPVDIADSVDPEEKIKMNYDIFVNPADAIYSTSDYKLLTQGVKAADIAKRIAVGANLPKVAVGAGLYGDRLEKQWHGFGSVFATLEIPLTGWWGGSYAIRRSKLNQQIARNTLNDASELLQVKMNNSWDDYRTAYRKIEVARESIAQANENLRLNEAYYNAGTVTITDLLKAQTLFRQAHDQYVDAVGQYRVNEIKYLISTGR